MINKKEEDIIKQIIHELIIDEEEGEYINYIRDRFNDEELLYAYKHGKKQGYRQYVQDHK